MHLNQRTKNNLMQLTRALLLVACMTSLLVAKLSSPKRTFPARRAHWFAYFQPDTDNQPLTQQMDTPLSCKEWT